MCLPGSSIPRNSFLTWVHADKWVHIGMFGLLCILFCLPFKNSSVKSVSRLKWFVGIALLAVIYGVIMEFVQKYWIPNRSFELADIFADSAGCVSGLLFSWKKFGKA
jgi:VanZ family protein